MSRIVFHIDVNSAFLSWTAKKVLDEGYTRDIRNEVSVVGRKDVPNSILVAASVPAKKIGIHVPMLLSEAKKIYPDVVVAPADFEFYKKCSDSMMKILKEKFEHFQQASIDECFVEYDEKMQEKYGEPIHVADEIREYIYKKCGFTVNVGIGNNKLLAKMASDFEKPNKTHTLFKEEIEEKMWPLPIRDLYGCGEKYEQHLKKLGIHFIRDLARADKGMLKARLGSYGGALWDLANGIDDTKVENKYDERKGIGASSVTKGETKNRDYILSFIEGFSVELSIALKDLNKVASTLTVHVRYPNFKRKSHQRKVSYDLEDKDMIYKLAVELFDEFWKGETINLIGIQLGGLKDAKKRQASLFSFL